MVFNVLCLAHSSRGLLDIHPGWPRYKSSNPFPACHCARATLPLRQGFAWVPFWMKTDGNSSAQGYCHHIRNICSIYSCKHVYTQVYIYIYIHTHVHAGMYVYTYRYYYYICMQTCVCIYIYSMHGYTHYSNVCARLLLCMWEHSTIYLSYPAGASAIAPS